MIAFLLVLAGCSGGDTVGPSDDRALALLNESQTVMMDVESYRYTLDGHLESDDQRQVKITGNGAVNQTAERMNATAQIDDEARTTYVIGQREYVESTRPAYG